MTGHTLQAPGQQVVVHAAVVIFISDRKREKGRKRHAEISPCKETADGSEVEIVK